MFALTASRSSSLSVHQSRYSRSVHSVALRQLSGSAHARRQSVSRHLQPAVRSDPHHWRPSDTLCQHRVARGRHGRINPGNPDGIDAGSRQGLYGTHGRHGRQVTRGRCVVLLRCIFNDELFRLAINQSIDQSGCAFHQIGQKHQTLTISLYVSLLLI